MMILLLRKRNEMKSVRSQKSVFHILTCLLWSVFVCPVTVSARQIKIAVPGLTNLIAFQVAQEKGYYQQEGLEIVPIVMAATVANQALLGGNVEVNSAAGASLTAMIAGAPLKFVFTTFERPLHTLIARPEFREIKQLKGRKIAIPGGIGSGADSNLRIVLKKHGIEGGREILILGLATSALAYAALLGGSVDASLLAAEQAIRARESGYRALVSFTDEALGLVQPQGNIIVREDFFRSEPTATEKLIRATLKGLLYARANRAEAILIYSRRNKIKEDLGTKMLELISPAMVTDGTMSSAAQQKVVDGLLERIEKKEVPPLARMFDFSLTRKVYGELRTQGWNPRL
jgi:ABC-type nitrate/sulfonate/bicarbonate transport system substrate-binding protein